MLKRSISHIIMISILVLLLGCVENAPSTPNATPIVIPSVTSSTQTITPTLTKLPLQETMVSTLPPILSPEEISNKIGALLKTNGNCDSPCFWGFVAGQTTLDEVRHSLLEINRDLIETTPNHFNFGFNFKTYLQGSVQFLVQNDVVVSIDAYIGGHLNDRGVVREDWAAYQLESILESYGIPSNVVFSIDHPHEPVSNTNKVLYSYALFYDSLNVIILYDGGTIDAMDDFYRLCPGQAEVSYIRLWYGEEPENAPSLDFGTDLKTATSLTNEEFFRLIMDKPASACLELAADTFQE